ncbi:hypothetical protein [Thalassospira xiamenensis]|nr:hypothetical protein [Thalassospira xiamenensis]KZB56822.1 hypothetical protein AUP41_14430 [Thalassospira xiamenensis]
MSRLLGYLIIFMSGLAMTVVSVVRPEYLSDSNEFLRNFVNHEFLNILGVILAITLASVANIHLAFNRIEERYKTKNALTKSRHNLKKSAYWLIGLFVAGAVVVFIKPVACSSPVSIALFNSAALIILIWHILILVALTELVFRIEPSSPE